MAECSRSCQRDNLFNHRVHCNMVLLIPRTRLASPNTYHPTLNEAVESARAANVPVVIFPALLRLDLIEATPERFFRDIARARHKSCQSCIDANVKCVLHNGSSYRCLRCWIKQLRGCSHQDCKHPTRACEIDILTLG